MVLTKKKLEAVEIVVCFLCNSLTKSWCMSMTWLIFAPRLCQILSLPLSVATTCIISTRCIVSAGVCLYHVVCFVSTEYVVFFRLIFLASVHSSAFLDSSTSMNSYCWLCFFWSIKLKNSEVLTIFEGSRMLILLLYESNVPWVMIFFFPHLWKSLVDVICFQRLLLLHGKFTVMVLYN